MVITMKNIIPADNIKIDGKDIAWKSFNILGH